MYCIKHPTGERIEVLFMAGFSAFSKKHPVLAEAGDTLLSLLSGGLALLAVAGGWLRDTARRLSKSDS